MRFTIHVKLGRRVWWVGFSHESGREPFVDARGDIITTAVGHYDEATPSVRLGLDWRDPETE